MVKEQQKINNQIERNAKLNANTKAKKQIVNQSRIGQISSNTARAASTAKATANATTKSAARAAARDIPRDIARDASATRVASAVSAASAASSASAANTTSNNNNKLPKVKTNKANLNPILRDLESNPNMNKLAVIKGKLDKFIKATEKDQDYQAHALSLIKSKYSKYAKHLI